MLLQLRYIWQELAPTIWDGKRLVRTIATVLGLANDFTLWNIRIPAALIWNGYGYACTLDSRFGIILTTISSIIEEFLRFWGGKSFIELYRCFVFRISRVRHGFELAWAACFRESSLYTLVVITASCWCLTLSWLDIVRREFRPVAKSVFHASYLDLRRLRPNSVIAWVVSAKGSPM